MGLWCLSAAWSCRATAEEILEDPQKIYLQRLGLPCRLPAVFTCMTNPQKQAARSCFSYLHSMRLDMTRSMSMRSWRLILAPRPLLLASVKNQRARGCWLTCSLKTVPLTRALSTVSSASDLRLNQRLLLLQSKCSGTPGAPRNWKRSGNLSPNSGNTWLFLFFFVFERCNLSM